MLRQLYIIIQQIFQTILKKILQFKTKLYIHLINKKIDIVQKDTQLITIQNQLKSNGFISDKMQEIFTILFMGSSIFDIPHVKLLKYSATYSWKDVPTIIISKFININLPFDKIWSSPDEVDKFLYDCGFPIYERTPYKMDDIILLDWFIQNIVIYQLIRWEDNIGTIDLDELSYYETHNGHAILGGQIIIESVGINSTEPTEFKFKTIKYKEYIFNRNDPETDNYRYVRRLICTSILTLITLKYHMLIIHIQIGSQMNTLIEQINLNSPLRRLLSMFAYKCFGGIELVSIALLYDGLSQFFNLTPLSIKKYINTSKEFNFRKELDIREISQLDRRPNTIILRKYESIIREFVSDFINLNYYNSEFESLTDEKIFLNNIEQIYTNALNPKKSDKENLIDICVIIYSSLLHHELASNPTLYKYLCNPFDISTIIRTKPKTDNFNPNLIINDINQTIKAASTLLSTSVPSKSLNSDFEYIGINDDEKQIFRNFKSNLNSITTDNDCVLNPNKIECSIRW